MIDTLAKDDDWYILGAGAIGTLWASKILAQKMGCKILLSKEKQLDFPKKISVIDVDSKERSYPINTELVNNQRKINKLIICTKSYQTLDAIQSISHRLPVTATILILQNGMGQHEQIADIFPSFTLLAGTTTEGALLIEKGKVHNTGFGISYFGRWNSDQFLDINIVNELQNINMIQSKNIHKILWDKLSVNCVINPLTAIHQCKNGELLKDNNLLDKVNQLSSEIDSIAKHVGHIYSEKTNPNAINSSTTINESTLQRVLSVAKATCNNFSSMHQDIRYQRRTEIDFINGYLQRKSLEYNVNTPLNDEIVVQMNQLESYLEINSTNN